MRIHFWLLACKGFSSHWTTLWIHFQSCVCGCGVSSLVQKTSKGNRIEINSLLTEMFRTVLLMPFVIHHCQQWEETTKITRYRNTTNVLCIVSSGKGAWDLDEMIWECCLSQGCRPCFVLQVPAPQDHLPKLKHALITPIPLTGGDNSTMGGDNSSVGGDNSTAGDDHSTLIPAECVGGVVKVAVSSLNLGRTDNKKESAGQCNCLHCVSNPCCVRNNSVRAFFVDFTLVKFCFHFYLFGMQHRNPSFDV